MKFRNTNETAPATLQLAPMIDVVFLLLIFFLVTWSYARFENELDISVPAADESQDPKRRFGEQIINVTEDGRVIVNSAEMGDTELLCSPARGRTPAGSIDHSSWRSSRRLQTHRSRPEHLPQSKDLQCRVLHND